ncbi:MAG: hypothetical protein EZS28_023639 [Streblomastix strix]|uniref:VWFA domain-containing protein n=1 Tax=Streblomastix strix TaxID=222440 RepID=A0A5J4VEG5_9EUKA|nr:MAG: hypothetical protein EZS28_023639 [Streblomastix strix]
MADLLTVDYSVRVIASARTQVKIHALVTITRAPVVTVLVIDKIMMNKLDHAREAGQIFVDQLDARASLNIVEFGDTVIVRQEIVPTLDKEYLKNVISQIDQGGSINISDALIKAQEMLSAKTNINGTIGILLLSIGQVNDAIQDIEEIEIGEDNFYDAKDSLEQVGILQAEFSLAKELVIKRTNIKYFRPASVFNIKVHGYTTK